MQVKEDQFVPDLLSNDQNCSTMQATGTVQSNQLSVDHHDNRKQHGADSLRRRSLVQTGTFSNRFYINNTIKNSLFLDLKISKLGNKKKDTRISRYCLDTNLQSFIQIF